MADLSRESGRDSWKLRWYGSNGRRKSMRLGSMPKKTAEQFRTKFEELLGVRHGGGSLPLELSEWIDNKLSDDLRDKLASAGLMESRKRLTMAKFCDEFRASRTKVAAATAVRDRQVSDLLIEYFGADRPLESITARDGEAWQQWLSEKGNKRDKERRSLGDNTVRRRTGVARQMFNKAIKWNLIKENPFSDLSVTVLENRARQVFVSWADIIKVIEKAPSAEWRALIAFVRLTGCRVPSELVGLTWADVDLITKRIVIRSPKTAHRGGKHAMRSCPIFPELLPYLQELADAVGPGVDVPMSAPLFPMARNPKVNLRTGLSKMIVRAGLTVWDKLFVNLRSSRQTELLAVYPVADVCAWLGNSPAVAAQFYAQARTDVADRAASESILPGPIAGPISDKMGPKMGPITTHQRGSGSRSDNKKTQGNHWENKVPDALGGDADGVHQWAKRDSNPRHLLCKSSALTN
jgi:integrase